MLGAIDHAGDEAENIDLALLSESRDSVRAARRRLLATLDEAQRHLPGDAWLYGQRVRFQLDQGLIDAALETANECRVDRWWCGALVGYVHAYFGNLDGAVVAFEGAAGGLPAGLRSAWTDIGSLLPSSERSRFSSLSGVARDSLSRRFWWLATPLFSASHNPRAVEHAVRKTNLLLRTAIDIDEHYGWRAAFINDVNEQLLLRYGAPTAIRWMGQELDRSHHLVYLGLRDIRPIPPYTTAEYSSGRYAFGPRLDAVFDPFRALPDAWELRPPPGTRDSMDGPGTLWWPTEHMRWTGSPIATLPEGQWATFRRYDGLRLGAAIDLDSAAAEFHGLFTDSVTALLLASPGPDSIRTAGLAILPSTGRLAFDVRLPPDSVVLALEASPLHTPTGPAARTRRGWAPPPTLAQLPADRVALSDLLLVRLPADRALPASLDAALPRMLGSTTVRRSEPLGVFWEAYGIPPGDSVRVSLAVTAADDPGLLRRLGAALRLVEGPADGIAMAWQDPEAAVDPRAGRVPILPRALLLSFADLPPARYRLTLTVAVPGRAPVTGVRAFTLIP
jgi:hypothetical protein